MNQPGSDFLSSDFLMAVRDLFDDPTELLDFIDLGNAGERLLWGADKLREGDRPLSARRLPGEPDAGALATWAPSPNGFRYSVVTDTGQRSLDVSWTEVAAYIAERATPVRYGRLHARVHAIRDHERTYHPSHTPFRTSEIWAQVFADPWTRRLHDLRLAAVGARDAILPPPAISPTLF
ncbi:hypothetical protein ACX9I7_01195 [Streptomyces sp. L500]